MNSNRDKEMWQRIEAAFTPTAPELRSAERELAALRIKSLPASTGSRRVPDDAGHVTKRHTTLLVKLAATLTICVCLAWASSAIVTSKNLVEQTNFDLARLAINSNDDSQLWRQSVIRIRREVKLALHTLQQLASDTNERRDVYEAAQAALYRLQSNSSSRDPSEAVCDPQQAWLQAMMGATTAAKLKLIDSLEQLAAVGITALRNAKAPSETLHNLAIRQLDHWLAHRPSYLYSDEQRAITNR